MGCTELQQIQVSKFCLEEEKWFPCSTCCCIPGPELHSAFPAVETPLSCRDGTDIPGNPVGLEMAAADTTG